MVSDKSYFMVSLNNVEDLSFFYIDDLVEVWEKFDERGCLFVAKVYYVGFEYVFFADEKFFMDGLCFYLF